MKFETNSLKRGSSAKTLHDKSVIYPNNKIYKDYDTGNTIIACSIKAPKKIFYLMKNTM